MKARRVDETRRGGERSQDRELLWQLMWHAWHWFSLKQHSQVRALCVCVCLEQSGKENREITVMVCVSMHHHMMRPAVTLKWSPHAHAPPHTHTHKCPTQSGQWQATLNNYSQKWLWPRVWSHNGWKIATLWKAQYTSFRFIILHVLIISLTEKKKPYLSYQLRVSDEDNVKQLQSWDSKSLRNSLSTEWY